MKVLKLFLLGEDAIEDVKQIRLDALVALASGRLVEWSSDSVTVQKVVRFAPEQVMLECNYFLRMYDPVISKANPIITQVKPYLGYV